MLSQDRKMNSTLNHCTYFLCYRKEQDTALQTGQKIRTLILVEKPKVETESEYNKKYCS